MDRDRAKLLLEAYRPETSGPPDVEMAEALALVAADEELAGWLAESRAADRAFFEALHAIDIPEDLREFILLGMSARSGGYPEAADETDAVWIAALAGLHTPEGLRSKVLAAMEQSAARKEKPGFSWHRFGLPLAAAAGIALAWLWDFRHEAQGSAGNSSPIPVEVVEAAFRGAYESPLFRLDELREDYKELFHHLESKGLPCPCSLPPGLAKGKGIGCRELMVNGYRGSLICFDENENGTVHLVVLRREHVAGDLPDRNHPAFARNGAWVTARWQHGGNAFLLIGSTDENRLARLF